MAMIPRTVKLDAPIPAIYQKAFATLLRVNSEMGLNVTLRVVGGWVRDTLLGVCSNDIDIAIESPPHSVVSGERFAHEVSTFEAIQGGRARTVGVIRANPALSKHIETATVRVCGIPIEFCALRTDEYSENSRIPKVRYATPLEDALRRDFTINALFYNLNTNEVEDYTTGLEDLQERIIRCPLPPKETFHDDPLRLLRGVRFVGQLGKLKFHLHDSIPECVDDELLDALSLKVSRERIGKEFVKMMTAPQPERCVEILFAMSLLQKSLLVEVYMKQLPDKKKSLAEVERVEYLVEKDTHDQHAFGRVMWLNRVVCPSFSENCSVLCVEGDDKLVAMLFELVIPFFRGVPPLDVGLRIYALCVHGLKLPLRTFHCVRRMVDCYNTLRSHRLSITELQQPDMQDSTKLVVFEALGHLNDACVIPNAFNIVLCTFLMLEERYDLLHAAKGPTGALDFYTPLWRQLEGQQGLLGAHRHQLPINGSELKKMKIDPTKIGTLLMDIRKKVVLNPSIGREEIIDWLKEREGVKNTNA